jgi:ribose-phosphate pyrophosphokinase
MAQTLSLLSGTANPDLASNISAELGLRLGERTLLPFPDGELQVELNQDVRGHDVYLIQSTSPPVEKHLLELVLLADACHRAGAARITGVVPYFGYARQDRRSNRRQALGARVVADMLQATSLARLVVVDLHTAAIEGFFQMPIEHVSAVPLLAQAIRPWIGERSIVAAPDLGAVKLAEQYARILELPLAVIHKTRVSGQEVSVRQIVGNVGERTPVIVDDMLSTGGTIEAAVNALLAAGCRPDATVAVSHGLFVEHAEEILLPLPIGRIVTTDSVTQHPGRLAADVQTLGPLLAETIKRLHAGEPLDDLYSVVLNRLALSPP